MAHKGILQAAKYVNDTIEKLHLLEQAFERAEVSKYSLKNVASKPLNSFMPRAALWSSG